MAICLTSYLCVPYNLWLNQAKYFLSVQFKTLAPSLCSNFISISVEAHWSLIAETYHDPNSRIVNKLSDHHDNLPLNLIISFANRARLHTIRPENFTPAISAFGAQLRLPIR